MKSFIIIFAIIFAVLGCHHHKHRHKKEIYHHEDHHHYVDADLSKKSFTIEQDINLNFDEMPSEE